VTFTVHIHDMMNKANNLLIVLLIGMTECGDNFTTVGNNKLLMVKDQLTFFKAEEKCKEMGSRLVKTWNENEWKEVTEMK